MTLIERKLKAMDREFVENKLLGRRIDIGYLALRYQLPLKTTWLWLEECNHVWAGSYDEFRLRKLRVADLYKRVKETYTVIEQWEGA